MALLHIYDSSDGMIAQNANTRGAANRLPVSCGNDLAPALDELLATGATFGLKFI